MFQQLLASKHHRLRDSVPITIWPSGGLRLVTDIKKNNNKSRVKQEPRSAHGRAVNKSRAEQEPRSAHGRAVNNSRDHCPIFPLTTHFENIIGPKTLVDSFQNSNCVEYSGLGVISF